MKFLFTLLIFAFSTVHAAQSHLDLLSPTSDTNFGGYYLNIEKTMQDLSVTRLNAHEIQNQMRDQLENLSGSFSRVAQKQYLDIALENAITAVKAGHNQGMFQPIQFGPKEFIVVLDMDETLIGQWYASAAKNGAERVGLPVTVRDVSLASVDKDGTSLPTVTQNYSGAAFYVRPGVMEFLNELRGIEGFRGVVLYTAKEDKAAWDLYITWLTNDPRLNEYVIGFYTRNYLLYDGSVKVASKDLRMFDPSLEHVFMIDDNEKRIVQPDLSYQIPKFNPEVYLQKHATDPAVEKVNTQVFAQVSDVFKSCEEQVNSKAYKLLNACVSAKLGVKDTPPEALSKYLDYLRNTGMIVDQTWVTDNKIFTPDFFIAISKVLNEPFPQYVNGVLQEP